MDLKRSIAKTRSYASFFGFSLFPREVHHWLVSKVEVPFSALQPNINSSLDRKTIKERSFRTLSSQNKIKLATKLGRIIKLIPGIQLMAITGSVAANNALPEDDIDLIVITSTNCLWIIRPFFLLITSLFFRRRLPHENPSQTKDAFCPNLWLDMQSLALPQSKRSLYTAHEILQIFPIIDKSNTYNQFIFKNSWTKRYLANAYNSSFSFCDGKVVHRNLFQLFIIPINYFFFFSQFIYMLPKKTSETVNLHSAFLHTNNYSAKLAKHIRSE